MSLYLGIDFGTSTNYIVQWDCDKKTIKEEPFGEYGDSNVVDNVIYYTSKEKALGAIAIKKSIADNPLNLVRHVKRQIENDNWTTYIPSIKKNMTSKDIATDIFNEIRKKVELNHGGENIEGVVISVPFAFLYKERQKIKQSALDAGLKVIGMIEEPVAAAIRCLDYKNDLINDSKKNLMIFDLGGGTLDVTIFSCYKDSNYLNIEVLNTDGDKYLGGKDVTDYIVDYLLKSINLDISDITDKNLKTEIMDELNKVSEETKKEITEYGDYNIYTTINDSEIDIDMDENEFEIILKNNGFSDRLKYVIEDSVYDADLELVDIDEILLVGGSSKLKIVKELIEDMFNREPIEFDEPDRLVGEGAAIYCGNILDDGLKYKITSRLSQSIGREKDGKFYPIINKNSTYDTKSNIEWIFIGNRKKVVIDIYQGNTSDIKKCSKIGCIKVDIENIQQDYIGLELILDKEGTVKYVIYVENDSLKKSILKKGELD